MKNNWLASRNDIFVRTLFEDFFESWHDFDAIAACYRSGGPMDYTLLDAWVGTDTRKGRLWILKDLSRLLYSSPGASTRLHGHFFDWTLRTLFHETMKLKENAYQIELCSSLREMLSRHPDQEQELSRMLDEYNQLLETIHRAIDQGLGCIGELFCRALEHLREVAVRSGGNMLLVRFLLDRQDSLDSLPCPLGVQDILSRMFPGGAADAYTAVAIDCFNKGWYTDALTYGKRAHELHRHSRETGKLLEAIHKAIEPSG